MIRKTLIGIATALAMMAAAATSANAHSIGIAIGYGGPGWGGGYGWGGGGYGYGFTPAYDDCHGVVVGYRMKRVWFHGMPRFVQVPIWRTRCF